MEDREMKHALRRFVEIDEPPFSLTASSLISHARRRRRWFGIGTSAVATLALASAAALAVPLIADRNAAVACDVELPLAEQTRWPAFGVGPSSWPTPFPSGYAWPEPSPLPVLTGFPTSIPTGLPMSSSTNRAASSPTNHANSSPSVGLATPSEQPVSELDPVAPIVDQTRLAEMSCFLKQRMIELLPGWKFMGPAVSPPLEVFRDQYGYTYSAAAYVRHEGLECLINITVAPSGLGLAEPGISHYGPETVVRVSTAASSIRVSVEGNVITDEQVEEIANAPELDLFR